MTKARCQQISVSDTRYYHCISRCVRRAFLCGLDDYSGQSYEHRRSWVVERIGFLASVFAIDICAYAVMSNHYHLVVSLNPDEVSAWSDHEVAERWFRLFSGPNLVQRWYQGISLGRSERLVVKGFLALWRSRLCDLSWFMRCLNEPLARRANQEDGCTGRFWEGRFKSQALLDERALLACMAYVELNPIRAALCKIPEAADFTSIQQRIRAIQGEANSPVTLLSFSGSSDDRYGVPYQLDDYLELVDWAGRAIRQDKRGYIPDNTPRILERLDLNTEAVLKYWKGKQPQKYKAMGAKHQIQALAQRLGQRFLKGTHNPLFS